MLMLTEKDTAHAQEAMLQMQTAAEQTHDERTILNFKRCTINYGFNASRDAGDTVKLDKLVNEAHEILKTVNEKKYPEIAAMLNIYLANIYYLKLSSYKLAFEYYVKAYDLFKNTSVETFPDRHYTQYMIALAYYQFNDYNNAIKLSKEIESLYQTKDFISVFTAQMIGVSYVKLKLYDSALIYYRWILNNVDLSKNPVAWKGIAMGSIGNVYFYTNRFDKAIGYLDSGIVYTLQTNTTDNTADFASSLSAIYIKKGDLQLARKYVDIAHTSLYRSYTPSHSMQGFRWLYNCSIVYNALSGYYRAVNDPGKALMYIDSANFYKDSLNRRHDVNLKYQGEILVEREKTIQNEALLEQQVSKQKVIQNSVVTVIGLVMLITLLLYNRSKLKRRQLLAEKQLAEVELNNARVRLNEFTKSIIEKNKLIEEVKAEVNQLQLQQQHEAPSSPAVSSSLKILQEFVLLTDDDWKNFTHFFDTVYEGFLKRLKEKLPGLSPAETRFLALSKLKLTNKEMAAMLNVSTDAIRQARSRLKRKFNLTDEHALEDSIDKI